MVGVQHHSLLKYRTWQMNARSAYLNTLGQCCFALVAFCNFYSTQGYCGFNDGALHLVVGVLFLPLAATPLQALCTVTIFPSPCMILCSSELSSLPHNFTMKQRCRFCASSTSLFSLQFYSVILSFATFGWWLALIFLLDLCEASLRP